MSIFFYYWHSGLPRGSCDHNSFFQDNVEDKKNVLLEVVLAVEVLFCQSISYFETSPLMGMLSFSWRFLCLSLLFWYSESSSIDTAHVRLNNWPLLVASLRLLWSVSVFFDFMSLDKLLLSCRLCQQQWQSIDSCNMIEFLKQIGRSLYDLLLFFVHDCRESRVAWLLLISQRPLRHKCNVNIRTEIGIDANELKM